MVSEAAAPAGRSRSAPAVVTRPPRAAAAPAARPPGSRSAAPPTALAFQLAHVAGPPPTPPALSPGALATTRDGRTTVAPQLDRHPQRFQVAAHEAVHRMQFGAGGTRPFGDRTGLEREATHGGAALLSGLPFLPALAAPPGLALDFDPHAPGATCPGGCHQPSQPLRSDFIHFPDLSWSRVPPVKVKTPQEMLAEQPKTVTAELGRLEQSILGQRGTVFDQLELVRTAPPPPFRLPDATAPLDVGEVVPPDLRQRYGAALAAVAALQAGTDAKTLTLETQQDSRATLKAFALAVEDLAAGLSRAQGRRMQEFRAKEALANATSGRHPPPCPNCHSEVPRSLAPSPPALSATPAAVAKATPQRLKNVDEAASVEQWLTVVEDYKRSVDAMDDLLMSTLSGWGALDGSGLAYLKDQRAQLEQFQHDHPMAVPIPAVYYPEDRWVDAEDQPVAGGRVQVAMSIPWRFYLYHTGATPTGAVDGEWVLVDLTSPKPFVDRVPATWLDAVMFKQGTWDPPAALFAKLNNKLHFPKGTLHWTYPSGRNDTMAMTEPWGMSDWLRAIGMTLGAVALIAGIVLSAGLLAPAGVGFVGSVAVGAGLTSAGFNIAATVVEMEEKRAYGLLTPEDRDKALLSIGLDIVGALALGLGRLAVVAEEGSAALRLGKEVGAAARTLAVLNGRYLFLISRSAAFMKKAALAADVVQLWTATGDFIKAFDSIRSQPGLSPDQRDAALMKLLGTALLTGTLLTVSIRGGVKDIAGKTVTVSGIGDDRVLVGKPDPHASGPGLGVPAGHPPTGASVPHPVPVDGAHPTGLSRRPGQPQVDGNLPEGQVVVRVTRDQAGRIVDAQTYHHTGADPESIKIHQGLANQLVSDSAELRALLDQQRKAFGGAAAPLELQLELKKLFDEVAAMETKLVKPGLSPAKVTELNHQHALLQHEISSVKTALNDPALHGSFPSGVFGLPVKPTVLPKKGPGGTLVKPPNLPNPPAGHAYYLRSDGQWDLQLKAGFESSPRFNIEIIDGLPVTSNRAQVDSEFAGRPLTPEREAQLKAMGYVIQANQVVRRPPGHGTAGKPRMAALEIDSNGRIQIGEGLETLAEMQARIRGALSTKQAAQLGTLETQAAAGTKVVLVEGIYETGVTWGQVLTKPKQLELRALLKKHNLPDLEIDRLMNALVNKPGTLKVVSGTSPVRQAFPYRRAFGAVPAGVEVHHGDPLYLGGGSDPATLFGLASGPHDDVHAFFDALTLPAGQFKGTPLQPATLRTKVQSQLKPAAAVVDTATGQVSYERL